jgi:hypothetical protein
VAPFERMGEQGSTSGLIELPYPSLESLNYDEIQNILNAREQVMREPDGLLKTMLLKAMVVVETLFNTAKAQAQSLQNMTG